MIQKILFIFYCLIIVVNPTKADWVQVNNGLGILNVNTLCAYTSGGVNYIFAGTPFVGGNAGDIFVTTNNGNSWSISLNIPNNVYSLTYSGNYLYAGTANGMVYTTNNGANWLSANLPHAISRLAANNNYVFAGCNWRSFDPGGVYMSTNYGTNWAQTSLPTCQFGNYSAVTINVNNVYASGYCGTFVSTDYGANWTQSSASFQASSFVINGSNIFAGSGWLVGVYKSTDNAMNWTPTLLDSADIDALAVYNNIVFAGGATGGGFFISTNNGLTWIQRSEGGVNVISDLCISNGYIFAGTSGGGIYRRSLSELVGIEIITGALPTSFVLKQNYPNPFNPLTKIKFSVSQKSYIQLRIYDVLGRLKEELVDKELQSAEYEVSFDGSNFASGTYFYRLKSDNKIIDVKKMVIVK